MGKWQRKRNLILWEMKPCRSTSQKQEPTGFLCGIIQLMVGNSLLKLVCNYYIQVSSQSVYLMTNILRIIIYHPFLSLGVKIAGNVNKAQLTEIRVYGPGFRVQFSSRSKYIEYNNWFNILYHTTDTLHMYYTYICFTTQYLSSKIIH